MITHKELIKILSYDPETGLLVWRVSRGRVSAGQVAGQQNPSLYIYVRIDSKLYIAHRLIWFYMTKRWPKQEIDHRDRDRANNRWINLREATSRQNKANSKTYSKHGLKGVEYRPEKKHPWESRIMFRGQRKFLGCFSSKEEAHQAYCEEAKKLHGAFLTPSNHVAAVEVF